MPRGRPIKRTPSDRELDVMSVLWDLGSGTVAQVREELIDREEFESAYTTVLTLLRSLRRKDWVRVLNEGRAHRYYPAISQEHAQGEVLRRITITVFGGSRELLLTRLVSERTLPGVLKRLRHILDQRLAEHAGHGQIASSRSHG